MIILLVAGTLLAAVWIFIIAMVWREHRRSREIDRDLEAARREHRSWNISGQPRRR